MAKAAPPELVVSLIVGGDKLNEIRELERQFASAPAPTSLAERNPKTVIAERIEELRQKLAGTEVKFRLKAMPGKLWNRLQLARPMPEKGEDGDVFADRNFIWTCALIAASCTDPVMTPAQVAELADRIPGAAWDELGNSAYTLNAGTVSVPFSSAAFASMLDSDLTSRRPPEQEPPSASSEAKPVRKPRSTSTKTGG